MGVIEDEMALGGGASEIDKMDTSLWLGDTGASCHMTNSPEGIDRKSTRLNSSHP